MKTRTPISRAFFNSHFKLSADSAWTSLGNAPGRQRYATCGRSLVDRIRTFDGLESVLEPGFLIFGYYAAYFSILHFLSTFLHLLPIEKRKFLRYQRPVVLKIICHPSGPLLTLSRKSLLLHHPWNGTSRDCEPLSHRADDNAGAQQAISCRREIVPCYFITQNTVLASSVL